MHDTSLPNLPIHPTMRHPLTGEPLVATFVGRHGRIYWPVMGAAEGDGDGGDGGGAGGAGAGAGAGADGGQGGASGAGAGAGAGTGNATDEQGNDLGFPKDTPVVEMTDGQQAAYWRDKARKHEGRVKGLVGDRTPEDVKKDLEELAELKKAQQTPAEQALNDAREEGKKEGSTAERSKSAAAIFRGALEANGVSGDDLDEIASNFNVAGYITDDGVDTTKITNFAKKFSPGKGQQQERRRDFGGGQRREGGSGTERGSAGKAEASRRFKKNQQQSTTSGE